MTIAYRSGDQTIATAVSDPEFSAPLAGVNVNYVLRQKFQQLLANFSALSLNTAHPDYLTYVLVSEDDKRDVTGLVTEWMRTYAQKPAEYNEPGGNYSYNFIGFYGTFGVNETTVTGRDRFTRSVPVEIVRTFYLIGDITDPDNPADYATWQEIPIIPMTRYYYGSNPNLDVDFLADSPPFTVATIPSRTEYEALIATDAAAAGSFSIVAEPSTVSRWMGNIYMRETRYVKAV